MKLAIFDMDGTLFDTREANYQAYKCSLNVYGFDLSRDYFFNYCNGKYYMDFLPLIIGEVDELLIDKIHKLKKVKYQDYLHKVVKNNHLFNIINAIKTQYKIALVTSASRKNTTELLAFFGVDNLFDIIISQEDVREKKPNPEGFIKAMKFFDARLCDTVIFEDSIEGIEAAEQTGASIFTVKKFF